MTTPTTVVLVGGLAVLPKEWQDLQKHLKGKTKIITRAGLETKAGQPTSTWETEIQKIVQTIETEYSAGNKITLVGHSLGGYLAEGVARQCPEKIERLILLDSALLPKNALKPNEKHARRQALEKIITKTILGLSSQKIRTKALKPVAHIRGHKGKIKKEITQELGKKNNVQQVISELINENEWARKLQALQTRPLPPRVEIVIALGKRNPLSYGQQTWVNRWNQRAQTLRTQTRQNSAGKPETIIRTWTLPRTAHMLMIKPSPQIARIINSINIADQKQSKS
ncbi:alpha/beta fold hydrolase [Actinomycetaceae bacterium TAE3-ERU4]|nr:alpha/beta fold hydrolase [Actinomycetaceae bacterium TAE3-ERU4]